MSGVVRDAADVPEKRVGNDSVAVREVIDATVGCAPFTLRVLRAMRGRSFERTTGLAEELLFVLAGRGEVIVDGSHVAVEPETGLRLSPGARYELHNEDAGADLAVVSVALHDPLADAAGDAAAATAVSRLADQADEAATGERTFRIVFGAQRGCETATQFVGYIPVGAAPRHYHLYEEVIYVLDGDGVMHMNDSETTLRSGSAIHLPPRKLHTLENSGPGVMRVLGVFRPAGSPAAAFYPDGTPAYTADEPQAASAAQ
jgi:mannose-6-phosphate isomerase-like protein (cupin superfamily)